MTRARALKQVIRARAAKTGERYTTARRHVLTELNARATPTARFPAPAAVIAPAPKPAPAATVKGGLTDAKAREKTGHGLDHWFAVLDRFGGVEKGHTASARHLYDAHKVPGWYAQGITVAYERARGVRVANQRCDGEYEVSVTKMIAATPGAVIKAITDARLRKRWTAGVDADLAKALTAGLADRKSKGVVVRPDGLGRFRYKWDGTIVQLHLVPKPGDKVSFVVTNSKLAGSGMVESRRAVWRGAIDALARQCARSTT